MPNFNYSAAKAAGLSDEQINAYIAKRKAEGVNLDVHAPPQPIKLNAPGKALDALSSFLGIKQAGESVARLGGQLSNAGTKAVGSKVHAPVADPTLKSVIGDTATIGGTALALANPVNAPLKAVVGQAAAASGLTGGGKVLREGGGYGEALKQGGAKAVTTGAIVGALGLAGKGFQKLTEKAPAAIYKASTRLPNETDANRLMDEGLVGGRETLASKLQPAFSRVEQAVKESPRAGDIVNYSDALNDPQVTGLLSEARRTGESGSVLKTLSKIIPRKGPAPVSSVVDQFDELAGNANLDDPAQVEQLAEIFRKTVNSQPATASRVEALAQRRAIDAATPKGAFMDTATGYEARTKNAVADAMRKMIGQDAPDITDTLKTEQSLIALKDSLDAYGRAKSYGIPGSAGAVATRSLLHPALGTRMAAGLRSAGQSAQGPIMQAIRRLARYKATEGIGNL